MLTKLCLIFLALHAVIAQVEPNESLTNLQVTVLDAKILNPLINVDLDAPMILWPILYLKLDFGVVCLQTQKLWEQGHFDSVVGRNKECSQFYCNVKGPIQTWSQARVQRMLKGCILGAMPEYVSINEEDGGLTVNQTGIIFLGDKSSNEASQSYSLNVNDPLDHLASVLTPKYVLDLDLDTEVLGNALQVSTSAFHQGEISLCLFKPEYKEENLQADEAFGYNCHCKIVCLGFAPQDPTTLDRQGLQDAFWDCFGNVVIRDMKKDFDLYKDPNSGKIKTSVYNFTIFKDESGTDLVKMERTHVEL